MGTLTRRAAVLVALALAAAGCSGGVGRAPSPAGSLAFATERQVLLRDRAGTVTALADLPPDESVYGLTWSADGRYVGWVRDADGPIAVTVHEPATGSTATWNSDADRPVGGSIVGTRDGFVVLDDTGRLAYVDPAVLFDEGEPAFARPDVAEPGLLAADGERVLVDSTGLREVYEVRPDGTATRLFDDLGEEGEVRNAPLAAAALTADGSRIVYATGTHVGRCEFVPDIVVRDLATGAEVPVPDPVVPGSEHAVATSVTTGPDGRTFAAVTTNAGDCPGPKRSALFVLGADRWVKVTDDARWGAAGAGGTLAVIRDDGTLLAGDTRVATGVSLAAWNPRAS